MTAPPFSDHVNELASSDNIGSGATLCGEHTRQRLTRNWNVLSTHSRDQRGVTGAISNVPIRTVSVRIVSLLS